MERGTGQKTALVEAQESFGLQALCIATLRDIVLHLHNRPVDGRIVLDDLGEVRLGEHITYPRLTFENQQATVHLTNELDARK